MNPPLLESILFVASKPLTFKQIATSLHVSVEEVSACVDQLVGRYNTDTSGIHLLRSNDTLQFATNPAFAQFVDGFKRDEIAGELTKPQLETLTVIAYTGPVSRPEIEEIRGVNSAVILRNLMIRGLIEEYGASDAILPEYQLTTEALRHLGISQVSELPDYKVLHDHPHLTGRAAVDSSREH